MAIDSDEHRHDLRVYYEDTDAQGIVYHANYLRYCERGRTEMLDSLGNSLEDLMNKGILLVVHQMKLKFHSPARLQDHLTVVTTASLANRYRVTFSHRVFKRGADRPLFRASVEVVAMATDGHQLIEFPQELLSSARPAGSRKQ